VAVLPDGGEVSSSENNEVDLEEGDFKMHTVALAKIQHGVITKEDGEGHEIK